MSLSFVLMTAALCECSSGTYSLTHTSLSSLLAFSNTRSLIQPVMRPARCLRLGKHWLPQGSVLAVCGHSAFPVVCGLRCCLPLESIKQAAITTALGHSGEGGWLSDLKVCLPSFSCVHVCSAARRVRLSVTLWTVAHQAPPSVGFSKQDYRHGLHALLQGIFSTQDPANISAVSCFAGRFFTAEPLGQP